MILKTYTAKLLLHCHDWILFIGFGKYQLFCSLTRMCKFWAPSLVCLNRELCFTFFSSTLKCHHAISDSEIPPLWPTWCNRALRIFWCTPLLAFRLSFRIQKPLGRSMTEVRALKCMHIVLLTQLLTIKNYMCYFMTLHKLLLSSYLQTRTSGVTA